ncbi:hypothetical protein FA95DRAFT_1554003 [Auriscalpium vulgare]|uniref:Uncharacterized protein n=1 Tax=Auriscalpium vulgare TaxID=40419 RepID=A0ACB8S7Y0_9AGAM|nr:hypothetical protein FA95DRAFT_1554003 [Auriscalpium vulgare]
MKLKEIHRTSTFAWSPLSTPLLATGTVAGALDESFSNDSQLEIWAPNFLDKQEYELGAEGQSGPKGVVTNSARFNRIAWGYADGSRQQGIIAAGMENGELGIWDPEKIVAQADPSESLIFKNNTHTGPVRGLDFNPIQTSLFSSGAINGEIYIWDLKDPSKPYSPGARSSKLDEITALAWNNQVPHVLATASSTGYTVVWDLRGKREVVALAYGGGTGTLAGGASGGRRGMSDVAWHPDNATRLVTSSEDDASPVIMVWDLRNARAPEKILTGHEKGVLSLSWCKQDADLLLSSGKDNRALCWNPQTSEIIGELPSADNWAFQVQWSPRNPDLLATAFFDGTISVHSVQSTNDSAEGDITAATPRPDGADVFDDPGFSRSTQPTFTLKQPPKWLRRPVSSSFGYGGQLVSVSNLPSAQGRHQSGVVHLRKVVTEDSIVTRAERLRAAVESGDLSVLAQERGRDAEAKSEESVASWKALLSLFRADSREELITLLGFSKEAIAARVAEAVATLKPTSAAQEIAAATTLKSFSEEDLTDAKPHEPVVSFAEPERSPSEAGEDTLDAVGRALEATPSEVSASAASDNTNTPLADGESTTTAPSLFGDENAAGTPQLDAAADFFSTMGLGSQNAEDVQVVPHTNYGLDSSVAATIGSGPSSVASESIKSNTFRIYPPDESETDRLVTKAVVVGDFESAVSLCLSSDRFADAILLAVKGGPELLARTQKAYFERRTISLPYLRLFQSIVTNDLADIVQNADLQEWQEIFVVLCTFASQEEFPSLTEQLGSRLEFQGSVAKSSQDEDAAELRKNATLTYLAAGRLERLVNIWIEELAEEEKRIVVNEDQHGVSRYTAHAHALQTFIEKVTVFRAAAKYEDGDLKATNASGEDAAARSYKLSALYDRYFEYADFLATQGLVKEAVAYLKLTPPGYDGSPGSHIEFAAGRERLSIAAGVSNAVASSSTTKTPAVAPTQTIPSAPAVAPSKYPVYNPYAGAPQVQPAPAPAPSYEPYGQGVAPYAPAQPTHAQHAQQPYQPIAPLTYPSNGGYKPQPSMLPPAPNPGPIGPPPPRGYNGAPTSVPPPAPPPKRRENGGWNDAPPLSDRRTPSSSAPGKVSAITSPFPNAPAQPSVLPSPTYMGRGQSPAPVPPPPRPGSVTNRATQPPPPPPGSQRIQQGPPQEPYPPRGVPRGHMPGPAPPGPYARATPPPGGPPPPGPGGPPPQFRGGPPPPQAPPGPYARATPPPGGPPPPGPGGPPPQFRGGPPPQQAPPPPQGPGGMYRRTGSPGQPHPGVPPPPHRGGLPAGLPPPGMEAPPAAAPPPPRAAPQAPAGPKYPPGDRSHIPDSLKPIFIVISANVNHLKQTTPPQQRRLVDDLERRVNPLFDALNCETLSRTVVDALLEMTKAMENHDRDAALAIHLDLLTRSVSDDIALWMSGVKQLIMRL